MKVGVDGVLTGAWARTDGQKYILDAGTGCGLIALMIAQRNEEATIDAIDIDERSIAEAERNFLESPWKERLNARRISFNELVAEISGDTETRDTPVKYEHIVSNPPFFSSGVNPGQSRRMSARHQGELSPLTLLIYGKNLLRHQGRLSMIFPSEQLEHIVDKAISEGWQPTRITHVKGHSGIPEKRVLMELMISGDGIKTDSPETTDLILEESPGVPTEDYRDLCKDFYLKF